MEIERRKSEEEKLREWERIKRQEAEDEERLLRQMEVEIHAKRKAEKDEKSDEEKAKNRAEEEKRREMEREIQRQRSLSGGKTDFKRRKTVNPENEPISQPKVPQKAVIVHTEQSWEDIKRMQEEEEQRQLFELERKMLLEKEKNQPKKNLTRY